MDDALGVVYRMGRVSASPVAMNCRKWGLLASEEAHSYHWRCCNKQRENRRCTENHKDHEGIENAGSLDPAFSMPEDAVTFPEEELLCQ